MPRHVRQALKNTYTTPATHTTHAQVLSATVLLELQQGASGVYRAMSALDDPGMGLEEFDGNLGTALDAVIASSSYP
jgi:hypothetical protein